MIPNYRRTLLSCSFTVFASLLASAPLCADTLYSYAVLENLPCVTQGCAGNVGLAGTITVNQLSTLTRDNFVAWNLSIVHGSSNPIVLNQQNSSLTFSGTPTITATATTISIAINQIGDSFMFLSRTAPIGQWSYGAISAPSEIINTSGMIGFQTLSLPATFTANQLGDVAEAPEPAAIFLIGLGLAGLVARNALKRRRALSDNYMDRHPA